MRLSLLCLTFTERLKLFVCMLTVCLHKTLNVCYGILAAESCNHLNRAIVLINHLNR